MKKALMVLLAMFTVCVFAGPGRVEAATTRYSYKDLTKKTVTASEKKSINYINNYGGFRNVFPGKKFQPTKKITRREFVIILRNLYGATYAPTYYEDLLNANHKISASFACGRMVEVSKKIGYTIKWKAGTGTLTRADAAEYIYIFATFSDKLKPKIATK